MTREDEGEIMNHDRHADAHHEHEALQEHPEPLR